LQQTHKSEQARKTTTMQLAVATALLALAGLASPAAAVEPVRPAGPRAPFWSQPCQAEASRFCSDVATAGVPACLAAHERQLSTGCASQFLWRYRLTQDCKDEIAACHGKQIPVGQCLEADDKRLGDRCRAALLRGSRRDPTNAKVARAAKGKRPR
jgi:hypothetical protein